MTAAAIIFSIIGIVIGGIIAWFAALSRHIKQTAGLEGAAKSAEVLQVELRQQILKKDSEITHIRDELNTEKQEKVKTLTELTASLKNLEEQKALIETMKKEMTDTFNSLSAAALKSSSEDFIRLASEHLGKIAADTKGKLGEHQTAIGGLVKPLLEALKRYEEQIHVMESKRRQDYGGLEEQLKTLTSTNLRLQQETGNLVTALRKPQVSGSWGQLSLRRAAELAGMAPYCDFYEEVSVETENGRLRPDMIVRLPNGREIIVDAKAPVDAYLKVISATSEEERQKNLDDYVARVRTHMNELGTKKYWDQFSKSPEIVVMYLPGESFFSAALEHDHKLIEDSSLKKIVMATPTTFIALLKAIAYGWQQEQITKNAQMVNNLGKELYDRINALVRHFDDMGGALRKAINAYNDAIGSLEYRVLPSARRFKKLGVTGTDEISVLEQIDQTPRNISSAKTNTDED